MQRLDGVVIARAHHEVELEIAGRRWSGRSATPLPETLRRGARVTLEGALGAGSGARPVRLHLVAGVPLDLVVRARPGPATEKPAAFADGAPPLAVTLRLPGSGMPPVEARLMATRSAGLGEPEAGSAVRTDAALGDRATRPPGPGVDPAGRQPAPPRAAAGAPGHEPSGALSRSAGGDPDPILEGEVVGADRAGRTLLRILGRVLQVQESLHLPPGARVHLALPHRAAAGWAGERAAVAPDPAPEGPRSPASGPHPRPPRGPGETLAGRLLDVARRLAADGPRPDQAPSAAGARPKTAADAAGYARDPSGGWFRQLDLPLVHGPDMPSLRVSVRVDDRPDERAGAGAEEREGRPGRAIIAVDFERLGPCQLDVLCRAGRLDLQVRSQASLPEALRRAIAEVFVAARDTADLEGELQFAPGQLVRFEPAGPAADPLEA